MPVGFFWSVLMYTSHILWLGYKFVSYILYYFFKNCCPIYYKPHPLKNLQTQILVMTSHHQSIIIKLAYSEQKTLVCLISSTDNLLTIAMLFHTMSTNKHANTISICYVRKKGYDGLLQENLQCYCDQVASLWVLKHIQISLFRIMLADWWLTDYVISRIWVWKLF